MALTEIELSINQEGMTRAKIRKIVVGHFLEELSGPAKDETYNRYHYTVEKSQRWNVVLIRPANLKLGFDFRIDVTNIKFSKRTNAPSHLDFFNDLKFKHEQNPEYAEKVRIGIIRVLKMEEPSDVLRDINDEGIGMSPELLLKVSKWFAIEMDIRYWNGWGRTKYFVWLELMKKYDYRFSPTDKGYAFIDSAGNIVKEEKATDLLLNQGTLIDCF